MLNHKEKQKLARKLSGKSKGHFESTEWQTHKDAIAKKSKIEIKELNLTNKEP